MFQLGVCRSEKSGADLLRSEIPLGENANERVSGIELYVAIGKQKHGEPPDATKSADLSVPPVAVDCVCNQFSGVGVGDRDDHQKSERGKFASISARF